MPSRVPFTLLVFNSGDGSCAIGRVTFVDGLGIVEVPNGIETGKTAVLRGIPVHVQAERRMVIDSREELPFIDKLEMISKPAVHLLTQYTRSCVAIQFIGMYKRAHAIMLARVIPRVRQEATEQVDSPLQQRVIAY